MFFYYGMILVSAAAFYAIIIYFTSPEQSASIRDAIYTYNQNKDEL